MSFTEPTCYPLDRSLIAKLLAGIYLADGLSFIIVRAAGRAIRVQEPLKSELRYTETFFASTAISLDRSVILFIGKFTHNE